MRVSIRRTLRVSSHAGIPIEDLGVEPDHLHVMTREDLLNGNVDLISRAGSILAGREVYDLVIDVTGGTQTTLDLSITTLNLDRIDVYINGRPWGSRDATDGTSALIIDGNDPIPWAVEVQGFDQEGLAATFRFEA